MNSPIARSVTDPIGVCLGDAVAMTSVSALKTSLCEHLAAGRSLCLDASRLKRADLWLLQLLASASAAFSAKGLSFRVGGATDVLRAAFARCGISGDVADRILATEA